MSVIVDAGFDEATRKLLQDNGFDAATFADQRARLLAGAASEADNRVRGRVEAPAEGDVIALPAASDPARAALEDLGRAAIARGEVGCAILAGGMATRFGGVVKAGVEVVDGRSFLDVKLADVRLAAERADGRVPVYLMTSFATHDEVAALAAAASTERVPVAAFRQFVSIRLTPDGGLFEEDGRPSPYAPGHGDLTFALRRSGVLARFRAEGGRTLLMSNVDNVGASLDPAVIGAHVRGARPVTCELAEKERGDKGGAPARVAGKLQIVESFRFPPGFDQDTIPVFNTNTFVLDAAAIDRDFPLTWFAVKKSVDGRPAIQFERLVGELTALLPTTYLRVPRTGPDGRFLPVKDPEELALRRESIREVLRARGVLPG